MTRVAWLASAVTLVSACPLPAPQPCGGQERGGKEHCVAGAPIQTGAVPNDVQLSRCGNHEVALVPASFDGRLDALGLDGEPRGSAFFGVGTGPWAVAGQANDSVVTLFQTGEVARADACADRVGARFRTDALVDVTPPVTLRQPRDVDGDGTADSTVTRMRAATPQAIVRDATHAFIAYTNLLQPGLSAAEPPSFGSGLLVRVALSGGIDEAPTDQASLQLPCVNPQGLLLLTDAVWVSCSGPLGPDETGRQSALGDGMMVRVDKDPLAIQRTIPMERFAPGTPTLIANDLANGRLVVGSVVRPRIAVFDLDDAALSDAEVLTVPGKDPETVESIFEIDTDGYNAFAAIFSLDALWSFDAASPGGEMLYAVGPGGDAFGGVQAIDLAPDEEGFSVDGVALLGLSQQVVPIVILPIYGTGE